MRSQEETKALQSIKKTIRLSCISTSANLVVLGAHTGSLYFFERSSMKFMQLVVFEEMQEGITQVAFSPDLLFLAFASGHPLRRIYITPLPIKARRRKVRLNSTAIDNKETRKRMDKEKKKVISLPIFPLPCLSVIFPPLIDEEDGRELK